MEFKFDNTKYKFEKVKRNSEWNFYQSYLNFENITIATKEVELKLTDSIIVEGNVTENNFGKTIWVKYQKVDVDSLEYFKCILSEIKGLSRERVDKIFEEYGFKSKKEFIDYVEAGEEIKGIGPKKLELLKIKLEEAEKENKVAQLAVLIDNYNYATKIIEKCESLELFFESPYKWLSSLKIGFLKVDKIAREKLNIPLENKERNVYLVRHKFNEFNVKQSNYISLQDFKEYLIKDVKHIHKELDNYICENELLSVEGNRVYLKDIYEAETETPNLLIEFLSKEKIIEIPSNESQFENFIINFEHNNFILDKTQKQAIKNVVFGENIALLTGGAGTGKSTVTKGIIECLKDFGYNSLLVAPTGKAALRMSECIGKESSTMHSIIASVEYLDEEILCKKFSYLNKAVIVVDEVSMVSQRLMYDFLKSIKVLSKFVNFSKILFIGDQYQLPSVGSGQVLEDMLKSKLFNHTHLSKTFRQAEGSKILDNANKVRYKQDITYYKNDKEFYISSSDIEKVKKIYYLFKEKYANNEDFYKNFQIAVTTNKAREAINILFKEEVITDFKCKFQVNDKIINLKNNSKLGIINGDMGIVSHVTKKETTIYFYDKGQHITLNNIDLNNFDFAYACTVHKLQGSEYKSVLFILQNNPICDHRLFYTAITRAKENFMLLANSCTDIKNVCEKSNDYLRKTNFVNVLKSNFKKVGVDIDQMPS